jgi:hypothetical protein
MNDFLGNLIPLFGVIFTFGVPGIIIFWYLHNRHIERMKLIDKGLTSDEVREYYKGFNARSGPNPYSALKWGILFTMVGLGIFIGILLEAAGFTDSLVPVMILLFAGLGFLIYYGVLSSKRKKENENKPAVQNPQV